MRVPLQPGVVRLVEDRQVEGGQVEELDVESGVPAGELGYPRGHGDPVPPGTGAADDDLQDGTGHGRLLRLSD
jgi:hypothetical protein